MKLMPASSARWMILIESSWSVLPQAPNIIAPRHSGLTCTPVLPSGRISMAGTLRPGRERLGEAVRVVGPVVLLAVDEERRRPAHAARDRALEVLVDPPGDLLRAHVAHEPVEVEAQVLRVLHEVVGREPAACLEQAVVHLPEAALSAGGLSCESGDPRVRVLVERQLAEHEPEPVSQPPLHLLDRRIGPRAERALEVAELDQR